MPLDWPLWGMVALGVATWLALTFVTAPYGRHARAGLGPTLPAKAAWVLMESPAVLALLAFFFTGPNPGQPAAWALVALWLTHYGHRTFVFPFRLSANARRMPVFISLLGFSFNVFNAYLNGRWLSSHEYPVSWLWSPQFLVGAALFFAGQGLNLWADSVLLRLRAPGEQGYRIPRGGLYEWISCPNYLGELIEWLGFALAASSLAGLAFAFYTAANLVPRALAHHRWYRAQFADYPLQRRALLPYVL